MRKRTRWVDSRQTHLLFRQKRAIGTDKKAIAKALFHLMILGVLVTASTLFYVWSRVEVVKLTYAIGEASKEEKRLLMQHERLNIELARLMSPSRLSHLATTRFQLQNPKKSQIIYMTE